jgi:shikimate dehydrogenase
VKALQAVTDPQGKRVVLFGVGGARAVAMEMALPGGAEIIVVNRRRVRGEAVVQLLTSGTSFRA